MKKYQHAMRVAIDHPDFATGPKSLSDPGRRECSLLADELWPDNTHAANTLIDYMHTARWVLASDPPLADEVLAGRVSLTDARHRVALANDAGCKPVPSQTTPKADAPKCSQCGDRVSGNVSGSDATCGRCAMQAADRLDAGETAIAGERRIVGSWPRLEMERMRRSLGDERTATMLGLTATELECRAKNLPTDRPGRLTPDGKPQPDLPEKRYRHRKGTGRPVQDHQQAGDQQVAHRHGAAFIPARNPDWNPELVEPGGEAVFHARKLRRGVWQTGLPAPSKSELYMQPERCRELVEEWGSKAAAAEAAGVAPRTLDTWLSG